MNFRFLGREHYVPAVTIAFFLGVTWVMLHFAVAAVREKVVELAEIERTRRYEAMTEMLPKPSTDDAADAATLRAARRQRQPSTTASA